MSNVFDTQVARWLHAAPAGEAGKYTLEFDEKFFGNPIIRSIHGGVTAALIEIAAQAETEKRMEQSGNIWVLSSSIDYLRITKDQDMYARASVQRLSRRLSVVDVFCWQDSEDLPVARGIVTLKVEASV